ncbi:F0F1 ATP synthase subunit delta [Mariprofundus ferrooxydans]|uniref:ATP synthase subunit delta n=1 Tax=Mariprofundus ferrooxydans PV-1 TaxID=314345 RepID=Q0EZP0_9PROT|nr:F0F1 ATP synthase subunit delta [Mariprofundus ferrooxydans]EAU54664.1 ATP synthase F1, delta subunit [Mariprofundus ferrooxydans PV-1]KON46968.1 ATP synthase F1 subunit delta [Mariprofundus ferrooxydans]
MSTLAISRRYAQALFELIQEGSDLAEGLSKLAAVASVEEVRQTLVTPSIAAEVKIAILDKVCGGLSAELGRLLTLLGSKNKLELLPEINAMVEQLIRDSESEISAVVTSAVKLTAKTQSDITAALTKQSGRKVRLETALDASLLGGIVVHIGDRQIDYSVRSRLESMRKTMAG